MNLPALFAIVALVSALLAGAGAWRVQDWRHDAMDKARIEHDAEVRRQHERAADMAAEAHEQDKAAIQTVFRTITKEVEHVVEKPVYRNVCVDADGLRVANRAIAGASAASGPAPAVPRPAASR